MVYDNLIIIASNKWYLYFLFISIIISILFKYIKQNWYPFVKPIPLLWLLFPILLSYYTILKNTFFTCITIGLFWGLIGDILLLNPKWFMQVIICMYIFVYVNNVKIFIIHNIMHI